MYSYKNCVSLFTFIVINFSQVTSTQYHVDLELSVDYDYMKDPFFSDLNYYVDNYANYSKRIFEYDNNTQSTIQGMIKIHVDGKLELLQSLDDVLSPVKLTVTVNNGYEDAAKIVVVIKIISENRNSPIFIENSDGFNYCESVFEVEENKHFKIEIIAYDADSHHSGELRITQLNHLDNFLTLTNDFTQINETRKAVVSNVNKFDYEDPFTPNTYYIVYQVNDNGRPRRYGYCYLTIKILDVNDNAPKFTQNSYNLLIYKALVKAVHWHYRFLAIDVDTSNDNGRVEYKFHESTIERVRSKFSLSKDGVVALISDALPESDETFEFSIVAHDLSTPRLYSEPIMVTIRIFTIKVFITPTVIDAYAKIFIKNVSDLAKPDDVFFSFRVQILSRNVTKPGFDCSILDSEFSNNFILENPEKYKTNPQEELDSIRRCIIKFSHQADFTKIKPDGFYFILRAMATSKTDGIRQFEDKIIRVNIIRENSNKPEFLVSGLRFAVDASDANKSIGFVKAYDKDTEPHNEIVYQLNGEFMDSFSLNETTGELKLLNPILTSESVELSVTAMNPQSTHKHHNSVNVYVDLIGSNKNPPKYTKQLYEFFIVDENPTIGTISAFDADLHSHFHYTLNDSTFAVTNHEDSLSSKTAQIYINNPLRKYLYNVKATVFDSKYKSECDLIINVTSLKLLHDASAMHNSAVAYYNTLWFTISVVAVLWT